MEPIVKQFGATQLEIADQVECLAWLELTFVVGQVSSSLKLVASLPPQAAAATQNAA